MKLLRREFLSLISKGAAAAAAVAAFPGLVYAASRDAFNANKLADAISARYPGMTAADSDAVTLEAPPIAENGAVVPITVSSTLAGVKSISVFVENNPAPMSCSFNLGGSSVPEVDVRLRMGKTSDVYALVETGDGLFQTKKEVKVTIGGCGG